MKPLRIAAGSKILLGAPSRPMPKSVSDAIGKVASEIPEVIEAHLPQCFVQEVMETPAQILVLVVESRTSIAPVLDSLIGRLSTVLPEGMNLDVWPIERFHSSLAAVRNANCQVYKSG